MLYDLLTGSQDVISDYWRRKQNAEDENQLAVDLHTIQNSVHEIQTQIALSKSIQKVIPSAGLSEQDQNRLMALLHQTKCDLIDESDRNNEIKGLRDFLSAFQKDEEKKWHELVTPKVKQRLNALDIWGLYSEKPEEAKNCRAKLSIYSEKPRNSNEVETFIRIYKRADEIINSVGINPAVTNFVQYVSAGHATVADLTPEIMHWIGEHNLGSRIKLTL